MRKHALLTTALFIPFLLMAKTGNGESDTPLADIPPEFLILQQGKRYDYQTGILRTWTSIPAGENRSAATPRLVAETFLSEHAGELGIRSDLQDIRFEREVESLGGTYVTYNQFVDGIPVFRGDIVLTVNRLNQVSYLRNNARSLDITTTRAAIAPATAFQTALTELNSTESPYYAPEPELMVYAEDGSSHLVWMVDMVLFEPRGDWRVFIDAGSGLVLAVENRMVHVDGSGLAFDPDPLTTAGVTYGGAYVDAGDSDVEVLNAERVTVDLLDITQNGSTYSLVGPYCTVEDWDSPTVPPATATTPDGFTFTRAESGFEDVMVYHFLDQSQRYIQSLDFTNVNNESQNADPHGFNGADNSAYYPGLDKLTFGEGGVDDAEDADVILHELGHAIQHDQVSNWGGGHEPAMGEGFGDYWAGSYSRTVSTFMDHWVFSWDGHNPFWPGRILNANYHYPENANGQIHDSGQLWSASLWDSRIDPSVGREVMDALVIEHHFMIGSGATMADAAAAVIEADMNMFGGAHLVVLVTNFDARGMVDADDYDLSDPDDPSPVTNLTADNSVPREITLSWTDPTTLFGGDSIGAFVIDIHRDGEYVDSAPEAQEYYTDSGLLGQTTYEYLVIARTVPDDSTSIPAWISVTTTGPFCDPGDVNADSEINVLDIVGMVNIILGTNENPTPWELCAGDYNQDGSVNVLDIVLMVQVILEGGG